MIHAGDFLDGIRAVRYSRALPDWLLHNAQGSQVICAAAIYGKQNAADICGS
jgi:hypothetical protein